MVDTGLNGGMTIWHYSKQLAQASAGLYGAGGGTDADGRGGDSFSQA